MTRDIDARNHDITARPPRIEALPDSTLTEADWAHIRPLAQIGAWSEGKPPSPMMRTLLHHPAMFAYFLRAGMDLMQGGALPAHERELITIRTGWLCGAPFQFGEHVERAKAEGVSEAAIARVKLGSSAEGWSAREAALLKAVEELHADAMICDATWDALAQHLDRRQLIELPMIVGHYHMVAFIQNTLRVPLNAYNKGLAAG